MYQEHMCLMKAGKEVANYCVVGFAVFRDSDASSHGSHIAIAAYLRRLYSKVHSKPARSSFHSFHSIPTVVNGRACSS